MTNPSFSMVTCQSEDSGITWETSSSRCSTPWTSETSTTSDLYSMESSPVGSPPGKVIFIMDEGKLVRKRTRKSSNKVPMARSLKGGQGNKKRDSSGMQRQEPRTVLGDVQASVLNVEQVEAQDTDEEMLDDKENFENITEEPVKRAPIRSIFRESRLRKVGPILGGPVQARIQLFNSIFGGTGPAPETSEKTKVRRSSSVSGDSEQFLETSVKERLLKFNSHSEATRPKPFQGARSRILETPSERRRKQREQLLAHTDQSFSSPTPPLEKQLTKKDDVSSENIEPIKMKEATLQHEERKDRKPLLETPNQVSGQSLKSCPPEEAGKQQRYSPAIKTSVTEPTTSMSLEPDKKQVPLPSAENANKKPDQSLLTASHHLDELKNQEFQANSAPQSVSADSVDQLERITQHNLPTASMSEHPEKEAQKPSLSHAPSAESKYSSLTETEQEDIPQSSESAQSESEHVLLPYSEGETEQQETKSLSSTTVLSESETSGLMYSAESKESQKTPLSETQNVHLENETKPEQAFSSSLQETDEQGLKLNLPVPENIDSKYFGISYPIQTGTEETQKTSAINKAVDFDHSGFSVEKNKQTESAQMEMEHPDFSYSSQETEGSETTQMETEHLDFSSSKEETEELEGAEREHPDFSFSREEMEEPESAQQETEHADFSHSREETKESNSAVQETEYPELLFSAKETEKSGSSQLETEHQDFFSKEETKKSESAHLEVEHPDFSFSREEMEEPESAQLEMEHPDLSYSREETEECDRTVQETEYPELLFSTKEMEKSGSSQLETEHQDFFSKEETKKSESAHLEVEHPDFSFSREEMEEPGSAQLETEHPDLSSSREETEECDRTVQETEYPELLFSTKEMEKSGSSQLETEHQDFFSKEETKSESAHLEMKHPDFSFSREEMEEPESAQLEIEHPDSSYFREEMMETESAQLQTKHPDLSYSREEMVESESAQLEMAHPDSSLTEEVVEESKNTQLEMVHQEFLSSRQETEKQTCDDFELKQPESYFPEEGEHEEKEELGLVEEGEKENTTELQLVHPDTFDSTRRAEKHQTGYLETALSDLPCPVNKTKHKELSQADSDNSLYAYFSDKGEQLQPVQQDSQHGGKLGSSAKQLQEETTQLQPEHPTWSYSTGKEQQHKTSQLRAKQAETTYSAGKTEQHQMLQPKLEQTDSTYSEEETAQEGVQRNLEGPEPSYFVSEAEQQEKVQLVSENKDFSFISGEEVQKGVEPGSLGSHLTDRVKPWETTQLEQEQSFSSCSTAGTQQQETSPLNVSKPDISYSFGRTEHKDSVQRELKQQETGEQKAVLIETEYPDLSESRDKEEPQVIDQINLAQQEIAKPGLVHPSLPYSFSKQMQEEMQTEPVYPEQTFYVSTETQEELMQNKSEQPFLPCSPGKTEEKETVHPELEQTFLPSSSGKEAPLEMEISSEYPDLSYSFYEAEQEKTLKNPTLQLHSKQQEVEAVVMEHPDFSCDRGESKPGSKVEQESGHPELSYSMGETGKQSEHWDSPETLDEAAQDESMEVESQYPNLPYTDVQRNQQETSQLDSKFSDLSYSFGKDKEQATQKFESKHQELPKMARKRASPATAQIESKHPETAPWEMKHPDLSHSTDETNQQEVEPLDQKHRKLSVGREKQQQITKQQLEQEKLSHSPGKMEHLKHAQESLEQPHLSFPIDRPDDEMTPLEAEPTDVVSSLDNTNMQQRVRQEIEKTYPFGKVEQKMVQPEEEISHLSPSVSSTEAELAEPGQGHPDLLYSIFKVGEVQTAQPNPEHPGLPKKSLEKVQETIQLGLEEPGALYGHDKMEPLPPAQLELGHTDLAPTAAEVGQEGMEHIAMECPNEGQSISRAEHPQAAKEKQGALDSSSHRGKVEQRQMSKTEPKHPDLSYSTDKAHPQETTQLLSGKPVLSSWPGQTEQGQTAQEEKPHFLHSFKKTAQVKKAPTELRHLELSHSGSEAEQETLNAKSNRSDLSAGRLEHHETIQPEAETMDLSYSLSETQQTQIAEEDLEYPDLLHSTGTVQQEKIQPKEQEQRGDFSSSLSKEEQWEDAGMQAEHLEFQCSMEKTEGLQNSQAKSEYADLSFSVGTAEPHKATEPESKEQSLLHSFVKTKPQAALPESEHSDVLGAMDKLLHVDLPSSVCEEKQRAQLEVKQERQSYALHPEETVQLKLEQQMFSSPHGTEEQPSKSLLKGEFADLYSSDKTEKQDTAQAGFMPSDFSHSTGKSEQLQPEQLKSKHLDLSYSLGKAETHGMKPPDLPHSYGESEQPQTPWLEHPEVPCFRAEIEQRDVAQPELPCTNLQYSDVVTEQPETPVSHTFARTEEQGTAHPDFKRLDLLSPTTEAEKHEMAPLRAGHSEKRDTGATSSLTAQLETEQQDLSFSTEEAEREKIQPYSSLTGKTVSVPLGTSHALSETYPEGSPKSSSVTRDLAPEHLDLSYSCCKTEHSESAQPESGSFFPRKEEENTKTIVHLPVVAKPEAEHEILPEAEREQTPHYFHTATQLESEQSNLPYSTDKVEALESQDYLTVPSKLETEPSVLFYSGDETSHQEIPPDSKPDAEYLVPMWSLAEQEKQSTQPLITQSIQSECKPVIPTHDEKQLQKINLSSRETASLKRVPLESMSPVHTQDQDTPQSCMDTKYLSSEQLRSPPKFTTEQDEQEMQSDEQTVPRSVTTESKVTAVADQQAALESFLPFHTLPGNSEPGKSVSVAFTDDKEKQNISSSLFDVAGMPGKQSNIVSDVYTEGEHRHEMQLYFEDQKNTTLEHLGAVSSDLGHETVTQKSQYYSGESPSSAEIKPAGSSSDEKQNPEVPSFGLVSWLVEEVKARSSSPIVPADVDRQEIKFSSNEASDFGSKQFSAGSFSELTLHGTIEKKGHRVSESVSNEFSRKKPSDTGHTRTQKYDLPSLIGDNQGPDNVLEHETSTVKPTKMEAMQHLGVDKVSEEPEHYLRGEEQEMGHPSAVEDSQCVPETTEQKDLFNIISEGYEILNIHAPTRISSVDQEESKHMPDKLEYLETNPSFRRKLAADDHKALDSGTTTDISDDSVWAKTANHELTELVKKDDVEETGEKQQENPLLPENNNFAILDPNNGTADMDYFEKYTLIDDKSPVKPYFERPMLLSPVTEDPNEPMEEAKSIKESPEVDTLEEFSLLEDVDEVFYGTMKGESKMQSYADASKPLPLQKSLDSSSKSNTNVEDERKSPGTPLFDSEEGVLERSLLFPTTVAAINPELLEEPPALSFLYKDLYAEAVGEKTKDETPSDEESGNSNASFPSRNSDTDDGTGIYFEKYILKDEIPSKAIGPQKDQTPEDESFSGGILVWNSENKEQGSGDVQCLKTEILPERGVVEKDKIQVDSDIQATICKPVHAIPFGSRTTISGARTDITEQTEEENVPAETTEEMPGHSRQQAYGQLVDYQGAAYKEAGDKHEEKQEEHHDIAAVSLMEKHIPRARASVEDSADDQYTQEHLSCVPTIQQTENPDLQGEKQHPDVYEDLAESMDYDVITQEELLQDEISSQFTHEELLFEDRDSFEHAVDSYEFVNEPEERTPVELEDSGFVVMYPEKSATNIPQIESPQREMKKSQVDTYCYHCKCPISAIDKLFGEHKDHEVTTLDDAATKMKDQLGELLIALEEKSIKIEEFVSDIELRFNSVEENCKKNADLLEKQNEEMLKKVVAQYDEKSENFEEVKKMKMEYLYEQMVNFQQTVDSAKETLETTVKETDEVDGFVFLKSSKELNKRLLSAMDTTLSLEKVPSAFSLFEHYADSPGQSSQHSLQHVAVPQIPTVVPQEPNSATSTSIAVYWSVNEGDVIDCFQVYCMEELQASKDAGALVEEYRVTVKESHCILEDLEPDRCYSVWVMAVNGTGCSLPSEKAIFKTAPAVPTIRAEDCTVCWDTATVRWRAGSVSAESFILEYCRQHSPEGEGLRSFAGIKKPELKVSLEPNVNYFFYLRAVNPFGTSEQSEAALISTKGTRFRLLSDTAHPALQISSNATVIHLPEKTKLTGFPSVLGELLPAQGCHYWEIIVSACRSYRIGICYDTITQTSVLGLSDTSWCMRCCPTQTSFLYRFLHTGVMSDVHVTEHLARIGILLDYSSGRLLFFNAEKGLVLFAIRHKFTNAAHPAFALEKAGVLTLCTGMELPEFAKHS